jgi:Fe-Mn family superoxide dismutase
MPMVRASRLAGERIGEALAEIRGVARHDSLLVLYVYEHAFHLDYGAAAARYIDAWFANLNWETVAARA